MNPETETRQPLQTTAAPSVPVNGYDSTHENHTIQRPNDVYRAIAEVARKISKLGIAKERKNQQQGYDFRGIDDVYNALAPLIAEADLCILPKMSERSEEEHETQNGRPLFYVTVRADFDFVSARDGSKHTVTMYGEAMDSADKATNKAMSAAYKYCCMQVFCIPTKGDNDADSQTPQIRQRKPPLPSEARYPESVAAAERRWDQDERRRHEQQPVEVPSKPPASVLSSKPWKNFGEMRKFFADLREKVGEVKYLEELQRAGVSKAEEFRSTNQAVECYARLAAIANQQEVA